MSSWCVNPTDTGMVGNSQQHAFGGSRATGVYPSVIRTNQSAAVDFKQQSGHHIPSSQSHHFNSIWRESQNTTYTMENSSHFHQTQSQQHKYVSLGIPPPPLHDSRRNYYAAHEATAGADKENFAASQRDKGKKSFADLFQSTMPSSADTLTTHGGAARTKQREDIARTHFLASKYQSEARGLTSPRYNEPVFDPQQRERGVGRGDTGADGHGRHDRTELMLQEMNSRIQTVTKMILNVNSNVNDKFEEMGRSVADSFEGMRLALERAEEERCLETKAAIHSLWSREPESYLGYNNTDNPQPQAQAEDPPPQSYRIDGMDPIQEEEEGEETPPAPAVAMAKAAEGGERKEEDSANDETLGGGDTLSITSEDAIEDDSSDDDGEGGTMEHTIRRKISKFLQSTK